MRRAHIYYAQCRPAEEHCIDWQADGADNEKWVCQGWERCAAPQEECTLSRCCSDPGYGCILDQGKLDRSEGWHAYCAPVNQTSHTPTAPAATAQTGASTSGSIGMLSMASSNNLLKSIYNFSMALKANKYLCERSSASFCREAVTHGIRERESYRHYLEEMILKAEKDVSPLMFAIIIIGCVVACLLACVCGAFAAIQMRNRAIQAELELQALRVFSTTNSSVQPQSPPLAGMREVDEEAEDEFPSSAHGSPHKVPDATDGAEEAHDQPGA